MRVHILGISGTFMSGIAILAKQCGHEVSGSDLNVYPPMSTQLLQQGIALKEGYDAAHISADVDCVIVGNVIKRGNPAMEFVMANGIPYESGPAWLAQHILAKRHVLAVAGTHGKTTTSSILLWILTEAGLAPGYLIGGVPENFGISADSGKAPYFVIEADEYDTAFFDKRPKFIHYRPRTLILNNLEYDHADIFPDLAAIQQQFHYLIRTVPANGLLIHNASDAALAETLEQGTYSPLCGFNHSAAAWQAALIKSDGSHFAVLHQGQQVGSVQWELLGQHNVANALAAIAAAQQVGVSPKQAMAALATFKNVKRRLEVKGRLNNVVLYDDFAHHPTAIAATLAGLRANIGKHARIIVVLEFGSYTMRAGVHQAALQAALHEANMVVCRTPVQDWGVGQLLTNFNQETYYHPDIDQLVAYLATKVQYGDHIVTMSNTGFGGVHQKLLLAIQEGLSL